ncbi:hypothetical protein NECAME_02131, partial [Necator americanus]
MQKVMEVYFSKSSNTMWCKMRKLPRICRLAVWSRFLRRHRQQHMYVSDAATIAKLPVASPPMECDSSVPSPPKTSVTFSSNASCAPHITRHASPPRKE